MNQPALVNNPRKVGKRFANPRVFTYVTYNDMKARVAITRHFNDFLKRLEIAFNKVRVVNKVLAEITRQCQFGENDQISLRLRGCLNTYPDLLEVTRKISGRRVDLPKANFHPAGSGRGPGLRLT